MTSERPSRHCLQRLRQHFSRLSPAQQVVAEYILKNPNDAMQASIHEIAARCRTSVGTVVRLAKDIGFEGVREMKLALALEVGTLIPNLTARQGSSRGNAAELLENTVLGLNETAAALDIPELQRVARLIAEAGHVDVYGASTSYLVGMDLVEKLKRLGIYASVYENSYMQAISATGLGPGDVAIGVSYSGETQSVVECVAMAREQGATTVALTNFTDSSIVDVSDVVLSTAVSRHLIPDGSLGGRIAQLYVVDALFIELFASDSERFDAAFHRYNQILLQKVGKSRDRLGLGLKHPGLGRGRSGDGPSAPPPTRSSAKTLTVAASTKKTAKNAKNTGKKSGAKTPRKESSHE